VGIPASQSSRRLALVLEYDGTRYAGFQLQVHQPTIQGEIEAALNNFTQENIRVRGASRTDAGAHARGQVVDFLTGAPYAVGTFPRALNYYLAPDVKVQAAFEMAADFHSRRDASSRTYQYRILNRTWPSPLDRHDHHWVREALDVKSMGAAAQYLVGTHDFRPLAVGHPKDKSAVRTVMRWDVLREDETVVIECEASGFLRHQIRRANGVLVAIGQGRCAGETLKNILENRGLAGLAGSSLPARGLCLVKVTYPNFWSKVRASDEKE
jgi:tRNA pseudouridine38-40 synthase